MYTSPLRLRPFGPKVKKLLCWEWAMFQAQAQAHIGRWYSRSQVVIRGWRWRAIP